MKTVVMPNQIGLRFRKAKFVDLVGPGVYRFCRGLDTYFIEVLDASEEIKSENIRADALIKYQGILASCVSINVNDNQYALHFVNGNFVGLLESGLHIFYKGEFDHTFQLLDCSTPLIDPSVPDYILDQLPPKIYIKLFVPLFHKGILLIDGTFKELLDPGCYYYWNKRGEVQINFIDTRLIALTIPGQELLTQDKATLRISVICNYRVVDPVKAVTLLDDYVEQLRLIVQLALRDYIGHLTFDEVLANKDQISGFIFETVKKKESELFIEVQNAGIKDIILPGDMRDIMNTVLIATKKAQANVITRREETASTRSLLNTAKLMEENKTLYHLKELEYLERISEHVGSINFSGSQDALTQLVRLIHNDKDK